jgi:hypothetical protein
MKRALSFIFAFLMAVAVHAQTPKSTELHGFVLGSTWEQVEPQVNKLNRASWTKYPDGRSFDIARYKSDAAKIAAGQEVEIAVPDNLFYNLKFRNKVLVAANVKIGPDHADFAKLLAEATTKYGKPALLKTSTAQNGYGARWELQSAVWDPQPDGCVVGLFQDVSSSNQLYSTLTIMTADEYKRLHREEKPIF